MITDEEIEKTIRESQEIIAKAENYEIEVKRLLEQSAQLFEQYNIDPDKLSEYLMEGDISAEHKRVIEHERERLNRELEDEIRLYQEKFNLEKQQKSPSSNSMFRKMQQMI